MFFLLLLLMFFGALGFGWVQQTNNAELKKETVQAKADLAAIQGREALIQDYIADIGKVINKPGTYEGRGDIYGGATIEYAGLMNPGEVKQVMDDAASTAGVSEASSLENLLGSLQVRISELTQRAKDAELERDKALADKSAGDQRYTALESQAAAASSENSSNLEQARSDFQSATDDRDSRIAQLTQNLRNKDEEMTTLKEDYAAKEKVFLGRIARLQTQNSALVEREALRQPPNVADGKVIVAKNGIAKAFINLGRKDLLQPGTVFRVKGPNDESVKGYCQVTRIEDERAEVRMFDFADPVGNYASEGDLLYNDLYTPRVTRTMYLMGRFSAPYGKEQLTNLLTRLGNRVVNKMGPGVDTVILGNNPVNEAGDGFDVIQESEEFKLANELRVEFTYLAKIGDLVKL
ncbi:MAG: hypothetical protein VYA51_08855 [Planctomycetota bacterium]|nr:hypothetical protein [Planctomycetota bacterium]